jgi:hypothetical protein
LLCFALDIGFLQMAYSRQHARNQYGRERSGKNETGRIRPDHVDNPAIRSDIAAHHAKGLAERALDDRYAVCHAVAFGNAAAMWAIHTYRMNFVAISERIIFIRQIANLCNRSYRAIH